MKLTVITNITCPFCNEPYYFLDLKSKNQYCNLLYLRCKNCRSQIVKHVSAFMTIFPKSDTEMEIGFDNESYLKSDNYKKKLEKQRIKKEKKK